MNTIQAEQQGMYFLLLIMAAGLVMVAIGPGLFHSHSLHSWQHEFFHILCHQDPLRSYSINGSKMAVCSRCFGIYSMFLLGIISMPLTAYFGNIPSKFMIKILVGVIVLNILDVAANAIGLWVNTLNSRFIFGASLGLSAALFLTNEFFIKIIKSEEYYGK